jgi:hypothetical protein
MSVLLEVTVGNAEPAALLMEEGDVVTVGASAQWRITAGGVLPEHGSVRLHQGRLLAKSVSSQEPIRVAGKIIGQSWFQVPLPASITIGQAHVEARAYSEDEDPNHDEMDDEMSTTLIAPPKAPKPVLGAQRLPKTGPSHEAVSERAPPLATGNAEFVEEVATIRHKQEAKHAAPAPRRVGDRTMKGIAPNTNVAPARPQTPNNALPSPRKPAPSVAPLAPPKAPAYAENDENGPSSEATRVAPIQSIEAPSLAHRPNSSLAPRARPTERGLPNVVANQYAQTTPISSADSGIESAEAATQRATAYAPIVPDARVGFTGSAAPAAPLFATDGFELPADLQAPGFAQPGFPRQPGFPQPGFPQPGFSQQPGFPGAMPTQGTPAGAQTGAAPKPKTLTPVRIAIFAMVPLCMLAAIPMLRDEMAGPKPRASTTTGSSTTAGTSGSNGDAVGTAIVGTTAATSGSPESGLGTNAAVPNGPTPNAGVYGPQGVIVALPTPVPEPTSSNGRPRPVPSALPATKERIAADYAFAGRYAEAAALYRELAKEESSPARTATFNETARILEQRGREGK